MRINLVTFKNIGYHHTVVYCPKGRGPWVLIPCSG
jgi:hypothetical protein